MGMSIEEKIEEDLKHCSLNGVKYSDYVKKHYIPKADYENRLKADTVAILTELQSQMANQENPYGFCGSGHGGWQLRNRECQDLIQEKINALRG